MSTDTGNTARVVLVRKKLQVEHSYKKSVISVPSFPFFLQETVIVAVGDVIISDF